MEHNQKKEGQLRIYFFLIFGLAFGFALAAALTGFIAASQHNSSTASQPQGFSTTTVSPQFSHLYFSPFFAKS
jgi:hypothetical protein